MEGTTSKVIQYLTKLSRPHVVTSDITRINFQKMKDMGIEKVIFDKYNTLVEHGYTKFPKESYRETLQKVEGIFGEKNMFMIANLHSSELINIREDIKLFEPEI